MLSHIIFTDIYQMSDVSVAGARQVSDKFLHELV